MKRFGLAALMVVSALMAVSLLLPACQEPLDEEEGAAAPTTGEGVALPGAVDQAFVEAEFKSTGAASGDSVLLGIKRLVVRDLSVTVPAGLLLQNPSAGEQNMVVRGLRGEAVGGDRYRPVSAMVLTDDDRREYILEAYCLDVEKDNPSEGGALFLAEPANPDVVAVLDAVGRVPDADGNINAVQGAVWAITGNVTLDDLRERGYDLSEDDLDMARAILEAAGLDPARYRLFGGP